MAPIQRPAPVAVLYSNLAFRPPPASNNSHISQTHAHPNAAAGPTHDETLAVENLTLTGVALRVARRRRAPVSPFIPKKVGVVKNQVARKPQRPRQTPVFGVASLMDAATYNLTVALGTKPPGARIVNHKDLGAQVLPADPQDTTVHVNDHEKLTRGYMDGEGFNEVVVTERSHCVCGEDQLSDQGGPGGLATLVPCVHCNRAFHPVCVGKGRSMQEASYTISRNEDLRYYLQNAFSCPDCDKKSSAKQRSTLSGKELSDEKARRDLVFAKRTALPEGEYNLRECDHCFVPITGVRYECRYDFAFDLCAECWSDPEITCKHQHVKGDLKWHNH
jgi:hypothetical protein